MFWKKLLGLAGEDKAAGFLKKNGYKIIERNYRCRYGEIDIIARQKDTWCFIEVKTIEKSASESPFETIGRQKVRHIENSAACYIAEKKLGGEKIRFDAIGIRANEGKSEIELIKDIF